MSYGPPPGGNQYGSAPPPGGGYGGYPPPQQQWGGYQQGPPQQQWGPPQGGPPGQFQQGPPQGGPPPGQYNQGPPQWQPPGGPPPGQQWQQPQGPPPGQQWQQPPGPPPNQQWPPQGQPGHQQWQAPGGPPPGQQQQWGAPPPNFQSHSPAPPGGPPPPQNLGGPVGQPSFGYVHGQLAQGWPGASSTADACRKAMKGMGTDEKALIAALAPLDPLQVNSVKQAYTQQHRRDLEKDIASETSKYFKEGLVAIVRGPLEQDAFNVKDAIQGAGTNEALLNDVVLGRTNADMRAIKQLFQQRYGQRMEDAISGDLSMKTKDLFLIVLSANRAEENVPVDPQQVDRDADELNRALQSRNEQIAICNVLARRSDGQIRAISQTFERKYRLPLRTALQKKFDGHMEDALVLMHDRAVDRIMAEAMLLEDAQAGMGTKDRLLLNRVVRIHWDKNFKEQVKRAYQQKYKKDLITRVRGETSGDYRNLLIACLQ